MPTNERLGLVFYRLNDRGIPTPLLEPGPPSTDEVANEGANEERNQLVNSPPAATYPWLDPTRQTITIADIPASLSSSPLAPSLLCFWASVAVLRIEQRGWNGYWDIPNIVLCDPASDIEMTSRWAPGGFEHTPGQGRDVKLKLPEYGKFIAVGAARQRMSHGGALVLTLLMVEPVTDNADEATVGSVVYRRRHLVNEVMSHKWGLLKETRKWELVFLC